MENKQHEEFLANELLDDKIPPKKKRKRKRQRSELLSYHEKKMSLMIPNTPLMLRCSVSLSGSTQAPAC